MASPRRWRSALRILWTTSSFFLALAVYIFTGTGALAASDFFPPSPTAALGDLLGAAANDPAARAQLDLHVLTKARKTGTTIVGVVFDGGVVLGADTRATEGATVCDKACAKIHRLADRVFCCGAGTSADAERLTQAVRLALLHQARLDDMCGGFKNGYGGGSDNDGGFVQVEAAHRLLKSRLYRARGAISAALVLGGVDASGPRLYQIHPHGSSDRVPYAALGSGSLAAMSVLESRHPLSLVASPATAATAAAAAAGTAGAAAVFASAGAEEGAAAPASVGAAGDTTTATSAAAAAAVLTTAERGGEDEPPALGLEAAKELVRLAVLAGIENDLGSGSHVDLCVITRRGATLSRELAAPPLGLDRVRKAPLPLPPPPRWTMPSLRRTLSSPEFSKRAEGEREDEAEEEALAASVVKSMTKGAAVVRPSRKATARVDWERMTLEASRGAELDDRIEIL